ncbi:MAG: hypothetical protein FJ010_10430 [Chloroflexi bacterium]|nr:hypothetical protein [Chloroflexota bacterium]
MNVIYSECSEKIWVDVAEILSARLGWKPCYWIGSPVVEGEVKQRFEEICFHSTIDAVKGIASPDFQGAESGILDQPLLEQLGECERTVLKMMDRMEALGSFPYQERLRHYHRLVAYWLSVLKTYQPEMIFFLYIPHMVFDYILYELCRLFGIRTLMFEVSNVLSYAYLRESIDGNTDLKTGYRQMMQTKAGDVALSEEIEAYLSSLRGDYDDVPLYVRYVSKEDIYHRQDGKSGFQRLFDFRNYPVMLTKQLSVMKSKFRTPDNYIKQPGRTPERSNLKGFEYRLFRRKAVRRVDRLAKRYQRMVVGEVDLDHPYVFLALSYQPEATTSPKGKVFSHLLLMVEMIAKTLPDGWLLYIKEHPAQFDHSWAFRSHNSRTESFYEDLAAMENVRLIPLSSSSYDLVDHSKAVATATGTVGWQAVNRGKPALVFGHPWYEGCEGIFSISSKEDCLGAFAAIRAGYKVNDRNVRLFVAALEKLGHKLDVIDQMRNVELIDPATAESLALAIEQFYHRIEQKTDPAL